MPTSRILGGGPRSRSCRPTAAAPPLLVILAVAGMIGGAASAPAQAESVFTDTSLPTITGTAVEGETLSETPAGWSAPPAAQFQQWQRCNSTGYECETIKKATGQTYRLTASDVGFTIRVSESARDAAGAVTPAVSIPTAVVSARPAGGQGGGGGGSSGSAPPSSCCTTPAHIGPAGIKRLLAHQITPSGKAGSILALLERGELSMSFSFPEAGTLTVKWYLLPTGAKLARKNGAKPVLVARGHAIFAKAGTLTVKVELTAQGKKLLKHANSVRLEVAGTFAAKGGAAVGVVKQLALKR
jgi:hypothetical protein